jgi:hypothetical protein
LVRSLEMCISLQQIIVRAYLHAVQYAA